MLQPPPLPLVPDPSLARPATPPAVSRATSLVRERAEASLARSGLWKNPYFATLQDGRMSLEAFRASQEQFYFAVAFFSRPMAGLVARSADYAARIDILHNVVEEHGDFRLSDSHPMTFQRFLASLGCDVRRLRDLRPAPGVQAFNSVLFSAGLLEEIETGIACIGIIEHAFAQLSAWIGRDVVARGWVDREKLVHYALHSELDVRHAEEFFQIIEPKWDDPGARERIERGLELGAYIFNRLYLDLCEIGLVCRVFSGKISA